MPTSKVAILAGMARRMIEPLTNLRSAALEVKRSACTQGQHPQTVSLIYYRQERKEVRNIFSSRLIYLEPSGL